MGSELVIEAPRRGVVGVRQPVQPVAAAIARLLRDGLDQRAANAAATIAGADEQVFQIARVSGEPGRPVQDRVGEADQASVAFGALVRNMHRWAAHLMVLTVFLHMIRVFYHGAYKPPREFNWVVGVVLLFLTIMLSFSGYLLPWDQIAFWAITIGTNFGSYFPIVATPVNRILLGGVEVGQNTLLRFYVVHIMVLPLVTAIFLAVHFWRIRKDGGISGPL